MACIRSRPRLERLISGKRSADTAHDGLVSRPAVGVEGFAGPEWSECDRGRDFACLRAGPNLARQAFESSTAALIIVRNSRRRG